MKQMALLPHWEKDVQTKFQNMKRFIKNTSIALLLFVINISFAQNKSQNVIELDSLTNLYKGEILKINKFNLNTRDLYGIDKSIEMYNVFIDSEALLLISVLPDLNSKENWTLVDINSIKDKVLTRSQTKSFINNIKNNNTSDKKTMAFSLLINKDGKYYTSKNTLVEFFYINNLPSPFIPSYGTINISQPLVTMKEMEAAYRNIKPDRGFPPSIKSTDISFPFTIYARNYLSKVYEIKGGKAYQFWTFDNWRAADFMAYYRGIDRFIYIPDKGIVGGSFDFYFSFNSPSNLLKQIESNIINEKVMIAEELK
ncbi:hypothetical protein [Elizabethkingia anophelis]|uniref:Uncharacterized protein n=2 Tax=Elizabethkingia anophelis TaxID=1117645 RepID=A0A1S6YYS8_9FLAO|nr:hypothetical protein [Elizabethkingia anophelis]AQX50443.1 hypothetical protein AYC66_07045 [Elizabethkingia anophelis]AQX88789.1 hypothetical protein AYC67_07025 [Elizabethkingia anophelis]OCW72661.1 hypothetical protein A4G24_13240 [Elizabethkingia anophelis]